MVNDSLSRRTYRKEMSINVVIFIICGIFFGLEAKSTVKLKEWGPYKSTLLGMKNCEKPLYPYRKVPIAAISMEIKNNIMRGNATAMKDNRNVKVSMEDYYHENGKLQRTFIIKDLSCRNSLIASLLTLFGITYHKKTCVVPKGSYYFEADYNKMEHIWMPSRQYGRMMRRVATRSGNATVLCLEFETLVQPKEEE